MKLALGMLLGSVLLAACATTGDDDSSSSAVAAPAGVCDPKKPDEALARLLSAPVLPQRMFNGVDPSGADWAGIGFDDFEKAYCSGDVDTEDERTVSVSWSAGAVAIQYDKSNRRVEYFGLTKGYRGTLDFASRPTALGAPDKPNPFGSHTYSVGIGTPVLRDGVPWAIDWTKRCSDAVPHGCLQEQATELFDALMYTFGSDLPSTQEDCAKQGVCLAQYQSGNGGYFGARPLGIYFTVTDSASPDAPMTTQSIYGFPVKLMPFSLADAFVKLDGDGPEIVAKNLGERHTTCALKIGTTYQSFVDDCTAIFDDPKRNAALEAKLLAGATRDVRAPNGLTTGALDATWDLEISGVYPMFASERFDETKPIPTAKMTGIVFNDRWLAKPLNDYTPDGQTLTLEASGAIYREYVRLVHEMVQHEMDPSLPRFGLGDAQCVATTPARGCTGMEQALLPVDPAKVSDPNVARMSVTGHDAQIRGYTTVFRTGVLSIAFCSDPTADDCYTKVGLFETTRAQVLGVVGGGDTSKLAPALRERKNYVRQWVKAFTKYLRAAPQHATNLGDPSLDALTPSDAEIVIEPIRDDLLSVKYANKFEYRVAYLTGAVDRIVFH